eukprot:gene6919-4200_t
MGKRWLVDGRINPSEKPQMTPQEGRAAAAARPRRAAAARPPRTHQCDGAVASERRLRPAEEGT